MSFILDALKKSETDRQRQTGPALFEVKVAPPKARFPVWAIAIVALLVFNMIIVGWLLFRHSSSGEETTAQSTPTTGAQQPGMGTSQPNYGQPQNTQMAPPPGYAPQNGAIGQ